MPAVLGLRAGCFAYGRHCLADHECRWATYSATSGIAIAGTFVLAIRGFNQDDRLVDNTGLFQRVAVISGFAWMSWLAARLRRQCATDAPS